MLDVFHIAKPQSCDIQTFYGDGANPSVNKFTWCKPRGISTVYVLLIGGGGNGDGTSGGGSGAVTVWLGSAINIPDILYPKPSNGNGQDTRLGYRGVSGSLTTLMSANGGSGATAGATTTAGVFAASGFYQSIAGQAGSTGGVAASGTTFLSGGGTTGISPIVANYGYYTSGNTGGYFQMQPIIVGVGGSGTEKGGIGCGGGKTSGIGGPGMVLIASW